MPWYCRRKMMKLSREFLKIINSKLYYVREEHQFLCTVQSTAASRKVAVGINEAASLSSTNNLWKMPQVEYDKEYLYNPANRDTICENIKMRMSDADIDKIIELNQRIRSKENCREDYSKLEKLLECELSKIPNNTDPNVVLLGKEPKLVKICGVRPTFNFKPRELANIASKLNIIKSEQLSPLAGQRSYILLGALAELEQALINYTIATLKKHHFILHSVPDILPTEIIQRCGLLMNNDRTLVYRLKSHSPNSNFSLSGTAEMALAYRVMNTTFSHKELPLKLAAVSRCYRAEASSLAKERGIYRVHQFTKVEMFACCEQENSSQFLQTILDIQESMLNELKLHIQILDMPPHELGSPAYRKFDIEGWMPGRQLFGELTSCSNCTDYQSRRLNIKYKTTDRKLLHVHTLNGTACAIPRMLIAIVETYQLKSGDIAVPKVLIPYMKGKTVISKEEIPDMKVHKFNPRN